MSNVTPINRHQQAIAEGRDTGQLTSAHRCALVRIQDLAIDVSLTTEQSVGVSYSGHTHEIAVSVVPYAWIEQGDYRSEWYRHVYLPPGMNTADDSLDQLGMIALHLQTLLDEPTPGGAA